MGCLFEFIFELITEVFMEALMAVNRKLLRLILPVHWLRDSARNRVAAVLAVVDFLSLLCAAVGIGMLLLGKPDIKAFGAWLLIIPLGIMGVQAVVGFLAWVIRAGWKRK